MRWLSRTVTGLALLATLSNGCGSTSSDRLVLIFEGWDGNGITQNDVVTSASANVDVVAHCCMLELNGSCLPQNFESITPTLINATFRNNQASNIRLEGYTIRFDNSLSGLSDIQVFPQGGIKDLVGGRCSNLADRQCAIDDDCALASAVGSCEHSSTTVNGITLIDPSAKEHVNPKVFGQTVPVTVTFFASDPNQSFKTVAGYSVVFDDFDTCTSSTSGA